MDANSEILSHVTCGDGLDNHALHSLAEVLKLCMFVKLCTVEKSTGPGEHGGNRVSGGLATLLVDTIMPSDSSVSSLGLNRAIGSLEHRGHETKGAVALRYNIRLDITIVVLASPYESAAGLDAIGDHIIDETMLIPETCSLKLSSVVLLVDLLEDVLEATVVSLKNRVLGRQVAWVVSAESVLHACVSKSIDGLISVVHTHQDTGRWEVEHFEICGLRSILRLEGHCEFAGHFGAEIGRSVLITKRVSADDDGLGPAGDQSGDVRDNDRLSEDGATDDVPDGTVG